MDLKTFINHVDPPQTQTQKENLERSAKNKIHMSSYDLIYPHIVPNQEKLVLSLHAFLLEFNLYEYKNTKDINSVIEKMKFNAQLELGDFHKTDKEYPLTYYILVTNELNPCYKKSNRYRCVGIFITEHSGITAKDHYFPMTNLFLAYIHPFFRNHGLFFHIFQFLEYQRNVTGVLPPISTHMQNAMKSYQKKCFDDPDLKQKFYNKKRDLFSSYGIPNMDKYSDEAVLSLAAFFSQSSLVFPDIKNIPLLYMMKKSIEFYENLQKNPNDMQELREFFEKNPIFAESHSKKLQTALRAGV